MFAKLMRRRAQPSPLPAWREFLGRQAAFVAQKTVLDYCRVKSGRNEQRLFADADFQAALEHCRWQVFMASLADVAALTEAWARPHAADAQDLAAGLAREHAAVLAATAIPPAEAEAARAARVALPGHLAAMQLAPPRPANLLPLQAEAPLFATLPVHPDQRVGEGPSIRGALRFHIVSTQQELERRFDPAALASALCAPD